MPGWVAPAPLELQLWYGDFLVADLHQVFPHQGTWFASYDLRIVRGEGALQDKLLTYIEFCEDFHRRIADGQDHDFEEFDRFAPISDTGSWNARLPTGDCVPMEGRMWFADGQASWQHPETEPSTERAANDFWARVGKAEQSNEG
jgi:hypothetical protein